MFSIKRPSFLDRAWISLSFTVASCRAFIDRPQTDSMDLLERGEINTSPQSSSAQSSFMPCPPNPSFVPLNLISAATSTYPDYQSVRYFPGDENAPQILKDIRAQDEEGNGFFSEGKYEKAIQSYIHALETLTSVFHLPADRSIQVKNLAGFKEPIEVLNLNLGFLTTIRNSKNIGNIIHLDVSDDHLEWKLDLLYQCALIHHHIAKACKEKAQSNPSPEGKNQGMELSSPWSEKSIQLFRELEKYQISHMFSETQIALYYNLACALSIQQKDLSDSLNAFRACVNTTLKCIGAEYERESPKPGYWFDVLKYTLKAVYKDGDPDLQSLSGLLSQESYDLIKGILNSIENLKKNGFNPDEVQSWVQGEISDYF